MMASVFIFQLILFWLFDSKRLRISFIFSFSFTNNHFYLTVVQENTGAFINWWSNIFSQAERLCVHSGGIMWLFGREAVSERDNVLPHPPIVPSIHPPLPSYLALSRSPSPPPRPPTFLTAGLLSCRYLPRDKRIYWHNWSDINLILQRNWCLKDGDFVLVCKEVFCFLSLFNVKHDERACVRWGFVAGAHGLDWQWRDFLITCLLYLMSSTGCLSDYFRIRLLSVIWSQHCQPQTWTWGHAVARYMHIQRHMQTYTKQVLSRSMHTKGLRLHSG